MPDQPDRPDRTDQPVEPTTPEPPDPTWTPEDLPRLYQHALETGEAGELVRALCAVHGVNLRGLAELTGIPYSTIHRWSTGRQRGMPRTLRELQPLVRPSRSTRARIEAARSEHRFTSTGRPPKR